MKLKTIFASIYLLALLVNTGCKREDMLTYTNQSTMAPATVANIKVENRPGGAVITYQLPNDPNLLYVKAVYKFRSGEEITTKSSYFSDTLRIEGYGDTDEHEVSIYSVGKNEKLSAAQSVTIKPLTPPVQKTFSSVVLKETFGGALVKFYNEARANLSFVLMSDSTGRGDWYTVNTFYTKADSGNLTIRGFRPEERKFAVYVRDRWQNRSDTLAKALVPLAESLLDKGKFKELRLPTDNWQGHTWSGLSLRSMPFLWDNKWNDGNNVFHTVPNSGIPAWFTFDMGVKYALSRFKFYHRAGNNNDLYNNADVKLFEIWGSNNPNPDGTWASWDSLGTFASRKPSGLPLGQVNNEDIQFARVDGEDFDMPPMADGYRYLRFKILQVWGIAQMFYISELTFWGSPQ
ncbi:DUF5000 domain-containing lipoprotein [Niabella sp.]|uniref:DUF5000 domain-containing lipoprotein n=1 Tax=Niabella sp. TaxID=1962976 RepID=UPI00260CD3EA|nr:DUF5000 domain-containing lipoprotein [Niabella sp.]